MNGLRARLSFFRRALAVRRWAFVKYAWLLLGAYDLVLSQLIPKSIGDSFPKTVEALTAVSDYVSWQAWAGAGIGILVLASLEYSFRRVQPQTAGAGGAAVALTAGAAIEKSGADLAAAAAPAVRPSIAVLPFVNVSSDPEQEYFADGMADVLIGALSKLRWLQMISRNSSFTYKGKTTGHAAIRDELKVRYLVEGSVAKAGGRMRISASLIDTSSGVTLWNNRFDRDLTEIFALQDEIVRLVAAAIEPNIRAAEIQRAQAKPTQSLDAYDHYLKALADSNAITREGFTKAIAELDEAIRLDLNFAQAWALKADCHGRMINFGWAERNEFVQSTLAAADRAVQLDPDDAHALSIGAWAYYTFGRDLVKAIALANRALALNPNSAAVIANCAWPLIGHGESDLALSHLAVAGEMNPLDPRGFLRYLAIGAAHFFARRFDEALKALDESIARASKEAIVPRTFRTATLFHLGRLQEARIEAAGVMALNPRHTTRQAVLIPHRYPWMKEMLVEAFEASGIPREPGGASAKPVANALSKSEAPSIAVLPFTNMSSDPEQDYFADGMADVLIGALSKLRWLHVISRNSSFTYKGKSTGHAAIRDELKVRYLVEGSVAKAGGRMRISVGLIDTSSGVTLWNNRFDRDLTEMFALQDEIVRLVVAAIEPNIRSAEIQRAAAKPTQSLDAYDHYLRALADSNTFTREGFAKALTELDEAIKLDPMFAQAWSLKADVTGRMVNLGWREREDGEPEALSLIDRAIQLDPEDGHALSIGAWAYYTFGGDLAKAIGYAKRALALHPNSAAVILNSAWPLIGYGESDKALSHLALAREIDPLDPRSFLNYLAVSAAHLFAKRFPEALAAADESLARSPKGTIVAGVYRTAALFHLGRLDEARAQMKEALALNPALSAASTRRVPHRYPWMKELILEALVASGAPSTPGESGASLASNANSGARTEAPSIAGAAKSSIAVLPFENLSGEAEQDFIGDGLATDIIAGLSRVRSLFVISRDSTFQYKGKKTGAREAARDLNVRYILEGDVRRQADRIRVSVQLVNGESGQNLWTQRYDRKFADLFDLQDELTQSIVAQLEPELSHAEYERVKARRPETLDAWELYQRGNFFLNGRTKEDQLSAQKFFEAAIRSDPGFALAHAGLAYCIFFQTLLVLSPDANYDSALAAARRALELDNRDAWCHVAAGQAWLGKKDFDAAIREGQAALELNPSFASAYHLLAASYIHIGRASEAIPLLEKAIALSPRDPFMGVFQVRLAGANLYLGRYEAAAEIGAKAVSINNGWQGHAYYTAALGHLGRVNEARASVDAFMSVVSDASVQFVARNMPTIHQPSLDRLLDGLRKAGLRETAEEKPAATASQPPRGQSQPTIAVLPFENLSGDREQDYFADGVAEDIIGALARFRWLQIIGRASTQTFKGKSADPSTIGNELGARYVLTGSVRKSRDTIRVAAQLLDATTRAQVWSSHFDGDLSDLFKVQDDLTEKVVTAIEPALKSEEIRRSLAKGTSNLVAYDYYLRALSKAHLFSEDALHEVEALLRKAIELDPTFADAYAWLCLVLTKLIVGGWIKDGRSRSEQGAPAVDAGSRALELDPENGAALAHTAFAKAAFEGALDHAAKLARKALVIQPNSPATLAACGWTLIYDGDVDAALDCLLKAHRLDPVDPGGYRTLNGIALAYILKRDFSTAETWSRQSVALSPLQPVALRMRAIVLAYQGRIEEARSIGGTLRAGQGHYQLANSMRHQWMRDLIIEGMRIAGIPGEPEI